MSIILLIEERLFVRHCVHDCFDRSYPDHEIVAFGSLAEWRDSTERKNLKPAILIYFVATGLGQLTQSEFERLEALVPNVPVVVISDSASSDEIVRIIGYGARGYIPTSMPYFIAVEAVRFIEAGGTFVPAGNLLADRGQYQLPAGSRALTERQMKVAEAIGHGFANKQIAYQLKMSENTVKVHLRHIMKKLNVRNRTEIAIMTQRLLNGTGEYKPGKATTFRDGSSLQARTSQDEPSL
jgi:DNA-binding NarL/FixJ family response regulator